MRSLLIPVVISLASSASASGPLNTVYLTLGTAPDLVEVNLATGDRRFVGFERYPDVIAAWPVGRSGEREMVLATFDALQRRALRTWDPSTGAQLGISGYLDPDLTEPTGSGRGIPSQLRAVVPGPGGVVYLVGPDDETTTAPVRHLVMRVDRATGNRTVVSSSEGPSPVGSGVPITQPDDVILTPGGESMLVLDRFDGVIAIRLSTGERSVILAGTELGITPQEIELLSDGRILGLRFDPDLDAVFVTDPRSKTTELFSGEFGGNSRGTGPMFDMLSGLAVDNTGRIFVYDIGLRAVLEVERTTGNRRIVSGGDPKVGEGPSLPGLEYGLPIRLRGAYTPVGNHFLLY